MVEAMISDSDKLEEALQENLKLRTELAAEVAKTKGGASQRVSRGFHRIGLVLAALGFCSLGGGLQRKVRLRKCWPLVGRTERV
jgi:hypothetical protein